MVSNEELMEELNTVKAELRELKGGKQPTSKFNVVEDGGPTQQAVKIMSAAKSGGKYDGIDVGTVENMVEDEIGKSPSRNTTLRIMRKIASEFPKYSFKGGSSGEPSEIYYRP